MSATGSRASRPESGSEIARGIAQWCVDNNVPLPSGSMVLELLLTQRTAADSFERNPPQVLAEHRALLAFGHALAILTTVAQEGHQLAPPEDAKTTPVRFDYTTTFVAHEEEPHQ